MYRPRRPVQSRRLPNVMNKEYVAENYEARTSIWVAFAALLFCVGILAWHIFADLLPKMERQMIVIDSLKTRIDTLGVHDNSRLILDAKREQAMEEWRADFKRDNERKRKYDKDFPKYAPK